MEFNIKYTVCFRKIELNFFQIWIGHSAFEMVDLGGGGDFSSLALNVALFSLKH